MQRTKLLSALGVFIVVVGVAGLAHKPLAQAFYKLFSSAEAQSGEVLPAALQGRLDLQTECANVDFNAGPNSNASPYNVIPGANVPQENWCRMGWHDTTGRYFIIRNVPPGQYVVEGDIGGYSENRPEEWFGDIESIRAYKWDNPAAVEQVTIDADADNDNVSPSALPKCSAGATGSAAEGCYDGPGSGTLNVNDSALTDDYYAQFEYTNGGTDASCEIVHYRASGPVNPVCPSRSNRYYLNQSPQTHTFTLVQGADRLLLYGGMFEGVNGNRPTAGDYFNDYTSSIADPRIRIVRVANIDYTIDKQVNPGPYHPGDSVTYTVSVTNPNAEPLTGVDLVDDYDQTHIQITDRGDFASDDGSKLHRNNFSLAVNETRTFTYTAQVRSPYPDAVTSIDNTATASVPGLADKSDTGTINVILNSNFTVAKDATNAVKNGDQIDYPITVNYSGDTGDTLTIVDDYREDVLSINPDSLPIVVNGQTVVGVNDGSKVTWTASVPPSSSFSFTLRGTVRGSFPTDQNFPADVLQNKKFANTVTVTNVAGTSHSATAETQIIRLLIAKSFTSPNFTTEETWTPGTQEQVYLAVENGGGVALNDAVITDDFSDDFTRGVITGVNPTVSSGTFDNNSKVATWTNIDLQPGQQIELLANVDVARVLPQASNDFTNLFRYNNALLGNVDSNTIHASIVAAPNIITVKQAQVNGQASGTAQPGDNLAFTVHFVNTGSLAVTNLVINDDFLNSTVNIQSPVQGSSTAVAKSLLDLGSLTIGNGGVRQGSDNLRWNVGTLNPVDGPCTVQGNNTINCASGTPQSVTFAVDLTQNFPQAGTYTFTNVATYTSDQASGTTNQNQIVVSALPILSISKCIQPGCVLGNMVDPGAQFDYTLRLRNTGNAPATNVVAHDPFDGLNQDHLNFVSANPAPNSQNPLAWNVGTLAPGQTVDITITVKLDDTLPSGVTRIENDGQLTSAETSQVQSNIVVTTTEAQPALVITKAVDKSIANPGDTIVYTLTIQNVGAAATSSAVTVRDPLTGNNREYLTFVSSVPQTSNADPKDLQWNLGVLQPNQTATITITARIASVMPIGQTTIVDTGVITSETPNIESNPVVTVVTANPQISIVKTVDKTTAANGDTITYTLTYANQGNATATDLVVSDPFTNQNQQYLTLSSATPPFTVPSANSLTIPALAPGQSGKLVIAAKVGDTPCTPPSTITTIFDKASLTRGSEKIDSNQVSTAVNRTCTTPITITTPKTGRGTTIALLIAAVVGMVAAAGFVGLRQGWFRHIKTA